MTGLGSIDPREGRHIDLVSPHLAEDVRHRKHGFFLRGDVDPSVLTISALLFQEFR